MSSNRKICLLLFQFICLLSLNSHGQSARSSYTVNGKVYSIDEVNKQIEFIMEEVGVPGLSMAVINNGEIVFYNTYGYRDLNTKKVKKVNKRTKFEAASMSKSYIVFAAYKLVDQGLLNLDVPLYRYLEYDKLSHDERYKLITARMVLSHSAGLENHIYQNDENKLEIIDSPGSSFTYSGEGYVFLAEVIETIVDMPLERFIKKEVYRPLKLRQTFTTSRGRGNMNHASAHDHFGRHHKRWENKEPFVMSHIHSNARDYARLLIGTFNNKHIDKLSVNQILTPEINVNDQLHYGPGFELYINESDTMVFQGGSNTGFKGLGFYSPSDNSGFVYFGNSERAEKIGKILCKITTGIDLSPYFLGIYTNPYPSNANTVFKSYKQGGVEEAKRIIDKYMIPELPKELTVNDMVELVYYFKDENYELAKYIATEYFKKCPDCNGKIVFERWLNR